MHKLHLLLIAACCAYLATGIVAVAEQVQPCVRLDGLRVRVQRAVEGSATTAELEVLSKEAMRLADLAVDGSTQLGAYSLREMVLFRLCVSGQSLGDARELAYWVGQMRTTAMLIGRVDLPSAGLLSDYWVLQADLFDINGLSVEGGTKSRLRIERMERFLEQHPVREMAVTGQVMLGLLREYDHFGQSGCACELAEQVREIYRFEADVLTGVDKGFKYCKLLNGDADGTVVEQLNLLGAFEDSSSEYLLVYFGNDWQSSVEQASVSIDEIYKSLKLRGIESVLVSLDSDRISIVHGGENILAPGADSNRGLGRKLASCLGVVSTPRYVLLDKARRIVISGSEMDSLEAAIKAALDESRDFSEASGRGGRGSEGQSALAGQ